MTQLILQQKIDEAAKVDSEMYCLNDTLHKKIFEAGFQFGTRFALNEIQPLMVEFADFTRSADKTTNGEWIYNDGFYTIKQLLEEFINSKNK